MKEFLEEKESGIVLEEVFSRMKKLFGDDCVTEEVRNKFLADLNPSMLIVKLQSIEDNWNDYSESEREGLKSSWLDTEYPKF